MPQKIIITSLLVLSTACAQPKYYYQGNEKITLTPQTSVSRQNDTTQYYTNQNGTLLGVKDTVLVKLSPKFNIEQVISNYPIVSHKKLGSGMYTLTVKDGADPIAVANELHTDKSTAYAHPDFTKQIKSR